MHCRNRAQRPAYSVHESNSDARQSHNIYRPSQKAVAAWCRQDTHTHTHAHSLTRFIWLSIQIHLGFFLSNVAQTWAPASNGKKDECTAVQTSEKRIPKQLTHSGGRSPETTLLNVGRRALALVSPPQRKTQRLREKQTTTKKTHACIHQNPADKQTSVRSSASMRKNKQKIPS